MKMKLLATIRTVLWLFTAVCHGMVRHGDKALLDLAAAFSNDEFPISAKGLNRIETQTWKHEPILKKHFSPKSYQNLQLSFNYGGQHLPNSHQGTFNSNMKTQKLLYQPHPTLGMPQPSKKKNRHRKPKALPPTNPKRHSQLTHHFTESKKQLIKQTEYPTWTINQKAPAFIPQKEELTHSQSPSIPSLKLTAHQQPGDSAWAKLFSQRSNVPITRRNLSSASTSEKKGPVEFGFQKGESELKTETSSTNVSKKILSTQMKQSDIVFPETETNSNPAAILSTSTQTRLNLESTYTLKPQQLEFITNPPSFHTSLFQPTIMVSSSSQKESRQLSSKMILRRLLSISPSGSAQQSGTEKVSGANETLANKTILPASAKAREGSEAINMSKLNLSGNESSASGTKVTTLQSRHLPGTPDYNRNLPLASDGNLTTLHARSLLPKQDGNVTKLSESSITSKLSERSLSPKQGDNITTFQERRLSPEQIGNITILQERSLSPEQDSNTTTLKRSLPTERNDNVTTLHKRKLSPEPDSNITTVHKRNLAPEPEVNVTINEVINITSAPVNIITTQAPNNNPTTLATNITTSEGLPGLSKTDVATDERASERSISNISKREHQNEPSAPQTNITKREQTTQPGISTETPPIVSSIAKRKRSSMVMNQKNAFPPSDNVKRQDILRIVQNPSKKQQQRSQETDFIVSLPQRLSKFPATPERSLINLFLSKSRTTLPSRWQKQISKPNSQPGAEEFRPVSSSHTLVQLSTQLPTEMQSITDQPLMLNQWVLDFRGSLHRQIVAPSPKKTKWRQNQMPGYVIKSRQLSSATRLRLPSNPSFYRKKIYH